MGEGSSIQLLGFSVGVDTEKVREKALVFLRKHEDDAAIHKLKWNEPLTSDDLLALEAIFTSEGSSPEEIAEVSKEGGLGLFVRSLIGLDREAAKKAMAGFTTVRVLTANQIEFTNLIVNHLTSRGWMDPAQLYTSPFVDLHPAGAEGIFDDPLVDELVSLLAAVKQTPSRHEPRTRRTVMQAHLSVDVGKTSLRVGVSGGTASGGTISVAAGEYICFNVPGTCGPS